MNAIARNIGAVIVYAFSSIQGPPCATQYASAIGVAIPNAATTHLRRQSAYNRPPAASTSTSTSKAWLTPVRANCGKR